MVDFGLVSQHCWAVMAPYLPLTINRMRLTSISVKRPCVHNTSTAHRSPPFRCRHYGSGNACTASAHIFWVPPLLSCGEFLHKCNVARLNDA
eukprot:6683975-Pyramimonas_sp.AAC.1